MFEVNGLQAVDVSALPRNRGVEVLESGPDTFGIPCVTLSAPTREILVAYIVRYWGDEDLETTTSRIVEVV